MGSIADIATVALVGGIGYLVITKTNLLGNQKIQTPATQQDLNFDLVEGGTKTVTVQDAEGKKFTKKTQFGDGIVTDTLDIVADVSQATNPSLKELSDARNAGENKTIIEQFAAAGKDYMYGPLSPLLNLFGL